MKKIIKKLSLLFLVATLGISTSHATTVGLTLSSDKDTNMVSSGELITFTVGLTPEVVISGYTLDIQYDRAELGFVSAAQLTPFELAPSFFFPVGFFIDPTVSLMNSDSGRASVLGTSNSAPVGDLFSLTFTVLDIISDDRNDLMVGFLDAAADDINQAVGASKFDYEGEVKVVAQVSNVPVPAAMWLFGSGLIGLVITSRNRKYS